MSLSKIVACLLIFCCAPALTMEQIDKSYLEHIQACIGKQFASVHAAQNLAIENLETHINQLSNQLKQQEATLSCIKALTAHNKTEEAKNKTLLLYPVRIISSDHANDMTQSDKSKNAYSCLFLGINYLNEKNVTLYSIDQSLTITQLNPQCSHNMHSIHANLITNDFNVKIVQSLLNKAGAYAPNYVLPLPSKLPKTFIDKMKNDENGIAFCDTDNALIVFELINQETEQS